MPTLRQVMSVEAAGAAFRASEAWSLREQEVVAVRLTTGSPCDGHQDMFEPWPGSEQAVRRWFRLASGHAVGVTDRHDPLQQVYLWTAAPDHA